jgi:hypothetical protein
MSETAQGPYRRGWVAGVAEGRKLQADSTDTAELEHQAAAGLALYDLVERTHRGTHPERRTNCGICKALFEYKHRALTAEVLP